MLFFICSFSFFQTSLDLDESSDDADGHMERARVGIKHKKFVTEQKNFFTSK